MAKEKGKLLFKGADDKAITFQRAVFIVCNLKRLIKRPKKDGEKFSGLAAAATATTGAGSRKRSGAGYDDDGSSSGAGGFSNIMLACDGALANDLAAGSSFGPMLGCGQVGGGVRRRCPRDPMRRAFTLPTILCSSLALAPAASRPSDASGELGDTERDGSERQQQQHGDHSQAQAALDAQLAHSVRPTPGGAATTSWQVSPASATPAACPVHRGSKQVAAEAGARASVSCLATPTKARAADLQRHARSGSECAQVCEPSKSAPSVPGDSSPNQEQLQQHTGSGGGQVWCPIWALAMELLDLQQGRPRVSFGHGHLAAAAQQLAAPSPLPFLLAPRADLQGVAQDDGDESARSDFGEPENNEGREQEEAADSEEEGAKTDSIERMRMKRFSSALCLNDKVQDQHETIRGQAAAEEADDSKQQQKRQTRRLARQSKQSARKLGEQASAATSNERQAFGSRQKQQGRDSVCSREQRPPRGQDSHLLAPDDPVVALARQRRPSLTNQGSVNVDQQALFSAVECNQLERARTILEDGKANINSLNGDKLTCLDIAVLMGNVEMVKLLQAYSAKESSAFMSSEGRANQLHSLYVEARRLVEDLSRSLEAMGQPSALDNCLAGGCPDTSSSSGWWTSSSAAAATAAAAAAAAAAASQCSQSMTGSGLASADSSSLASAITAMTSSPSTGSNCSALEQPQLMLATGSLLSSALLEEKQRQLQYWKRRLELFMHMRYEFEQLEIPNAPELVVLQVVGETALGVKIVHSIQRCSPPTYALQSTSTVATGGGETSNLEGRRGLAGQQHQRARNALDQLASLASQRQLRCTTGPACSHRLLAGDLLLSGGGDLTHLSADGSGQPLLEGRQHGALSAASKRAAASKQQKLAVFDHFVAQQLSLLSQQQVCATPTGPRLLSTSGPLLSGDQRSGQPSQRRQQHLVYAHRQNESTDSACDQIAAANSRHSTLDAGQASGSLAYQLMTARPRAPLDQPMQVPMAAAVVPVAVLPVVELGGGPSGSEALGCLLAGGARRRRAASRRQAIITKYKIEWSLNGQFEPILNALIVYNTNSYPIECQIGELENGRKYYVRVSSGNHKGFSEPRRATPECLSPSSWRQVDGNKRRKYDEEVFRKFTKLILLNKHILADEHQASVLQRSLQPQQELWLAGASSAAAVHHTNCKSNLINMLLLDAATAPALVSDTLEAATHRGAKEPGCRELSGAGNESSLKVRKNLKNFFQSNSAKFHKLSNQNKRGLYLASVIYHSPSRVAQLRARHTDSGQQPAVAPTSNKDGGPPKEGGGSRGNNKSAIFTVPSNNPEEKILVTNDDRLPIIEIMNDVVSPSAIMGDFYWLLKINGTKWADIKRLRQQLQKSHSSSTLHLRIKLLAAIEQMQLALNLEDIGRLFYKPIQAHDGSIVICTSRHVESTKQVSNLSIKWSQQQKIIPRHLRKISDTIAHTQRAREREQREQLAAVARRKQFKRLSAGGHLCDATSVSAQQQPWLEAAGAPLESSALKAGSQAALNLEQPAGRPCECFQQRGDAAHASTATTSGSSSNSSLASSETAASATTGGAPTASAWSSGQFGANSCGRCACGRSSSATIVPPQPMSLAGQLAANHCQQQQFSSAPTSQRNSTQSARSSSMVSAPCYGAHHLFGQASSGSFSLAQSSGAPSSAAASGEQASSAGHLTSGAQMRQTHSQQLSPPQKSSTYLMLASLGLYDLLLLSLGEIIEFDQTSTVPLRRGLYLGFVQLQTTVESMRLLVPRARPNMIPCARIRDNAHVSREEWLLLKRFASLAPKTSWRPAAEGSAGVCGSKRNHFAHSHQQSMGRASDPAIWSSAGRAKGEKGGEESASEGEGRTCGGQAAGGQLRDRAKSVSPAMEAEAAECGGQASAADESRRRAQLAAAAVLAGRRQQQQSSPPVKEPGGEDASKLLRPENGAQPNHHNQQQQKHAHSDTDLAAAKAEKLAVASEAKSATGESGSSDPNLPAGLDGPCQRQQARPTDKGGAQLQTAAGQSPEETFVRLIGSAARRLLSELRAQLPTTYDEEADELVCVLAALNDEQNNRIYHVELIELSSQVAFILLLPAPENVCPVTSTERSNILADNRDYMLLPLQIFETIHIGTYEPDLLAKYSRLSAILETDLIVAQHEHRQAFSSSELRSTKTRVSHLQDMVAVADEFWRQLRWLVDVVAFARDKSQSTAALTGANAPGGALKLGAIWGHFELASSSVGVVSGGDQPGGSLSAALQSEGAADRSAIDVTKGGGGGGGGQEAAAASQAPHRLLPEIQLPRGSDESGDEEQSGSRDSHAGGEQQIECEVDVQFESRHARRQRRRRRRAAQSQPRTTREAPARRRPPQRLREASGPDQVEEAAGLRGDSEAECCGDQEEEGGDQGDEAEAIYAYHISLRDATRAAAQRKSSQQSVSVFVDSSVVLQGSDGGPRDSDWGTAAGSSNMLAASLGEDKGAPLLLGRATPSLEENRAPEVCEHSPSANCSAEQPLEEPWLPVGDELARRLLCSPFSDGDDEINTGCENNENISDERTNSEATRTGQQDAAAATSSHTTKRLSHHFKTTNPFLTDSFDF